MVKLPTPIDALLDGNEAYRGLLGNVRWQETAVFVGAGMSMGVGLYDSWPELIARFEQRLGPNQIRGKTKLEIAELLYVESIDDYHTLILEAFKQHRANVQKAVVEVARLQVPLFVTTNYDPGLRQTLGLLEPAQPTDEGVARVFALPDLPDPLQVPAGSCVHLHGYIEDNQTDSPEIILRQSEFEQHYAEGGQARAFMGRLLTNYDLLFLGFSFGDPFINDLLKSSRPPPALAAFERRRRHAFVSVPHFSGQLDGHSLDFVSLRRFGELLQKFGELDVIPLWYDDAENHRRVTDMLQELHPIRHAVRLSSPADTRRSSSFLSSHGAPSEGVDGNA